MKILLLIAILGSYFQGEVFACGNVTESCAVEEPKQEKPITIEEKKEPKINYTPENNGACGEDDKCSWKKDEKRTLDSIKQAFHNCFDTSEPVEERRERSSPCYQCLDRQYDLNIPNEYLFNDNNNVNCLNVNLQPNFEYQNVDSLAYNEPIITYDYPQPCFEPYQPNLSENSRDYNVITTNSLLPYQPPKKIPSPQAPTCYAQRYPQIDSPSENQKRFPCCTEIPYYVKKIEDEPQCPTPCYTQSTAQAATPSPPDYLCYCNHIPPQCNTIIDYSTLLECSPCYTQTRPQIKPSPPCTEDKPHCPTPCTKDKTQYSTPCTKDKPQYPTPRYAHCTAQASIPSSRGHLPCYTQIPYICYCTQIPPQCNTIIDYSTLQGSSPCYTQTCPQIKPNPPCTEDKSQCPTPCTKDKPQSPTPRYAESTAQAAIPSNPDYLPYYTQIPPQSNAIIDYSTPLGCSLCYTQTRPQIKPSPPRTEDKPQCPTPDCICYCTQIPPQCNTITDYSTLLGSSPCYTQTCPQIKPSPPCTEDKPQWPTPCAKDKPQCPTLRYAKSTAQAAIPSNPDYLPYYTQIPLQSNALVDYSTPLGSSPCYTQIRPLIKPSPPCTPPCWTRINSPFDTLDPSPSCPSLWCKQIYPQCFTPRSAQPTPLPCNQAQSQNTPQANTQPPAKPSPAPCYAQAQPKRDNEESTQADSQRSQSGTVLGKKYLAPCQNSQLCIPLFKPCTLPSCCYPFQRPCEALLPGEGANVINQVLDALKMAYKKEGKPFPPTAGCRCPPGCQPPTYEIIVHDNCYSCQ